MKDISLQRIVDIITEAFNIFDFSYIVSGGATYIVIGIFLYSEQLIKLPTSSFEIALFIACSILAVYVLGLLSWSVGKSLRKLSFKFDKDRNQQLRDLVRNYNEPSHEGDLTVLHVKADAFDTYLWTKLIAIKSDIPGIVNRLSFLNRLWIMQAVFEGLMGTCTLVILLLGYPIYEYWPEKDESYEATVLRIIGVLLAFIISLRCSSTAKDYARTRIKDLYAAYKVYINEPVVIDFDR